MKVLAVLLLCAFVTVQGRSADVQKSVALAALGENPWVVHLRVAVSTSGFLNSCIGSLIAGNWVLTAGSCVDDLRFVWLRYGSPNVITPELVLESSTAKVNPDGLLGLVSINRFVHPTDNIAPVSLLAEAKEVSEKSVNFCVYGDNGSDGPGEDLRCFEVTVSSEEDGSITVSSEAGKATSFDIGAPLVVDGVQSAVLVAAGDDSSAGKFVSVVEYLPWINEETGLKFH